MSNKDKFWGWVIVLFAAAYLPDAVLPQTSFFIKAITFLATIHGITHIAKVAIENDKNKKGIL